MRAARLSRSPRLLRVFALLSDGRPRSTMQIVRQARVCAVNSIAAELRANGVPVHCQRVGKEKWIYWMDTAPPN